MIGTARPADVAYAREVGAAEVIDVLAALFEQALAPVDVVIDAVGGELQARSFAVLKPGGTLISCVSEPDSALARQHAVSARFIPVRVDHAALNALAELIDAGGLRTRVGLVLPLERAREAHDMLEGVAPRPKGKIVLEVAAGAGETLERAPRRGRAWVCFSPSGR